MARCLLFAAWSSCCFLDAATAEGCGNLPCYPFCTSNHCPKDCKHTKLKDDKLGPLAVAFPPQAQGCYSDHSPKAGGANKGTRLMECGVWGCSGSWGCGGSHVGSDCPAKDCPPWPAGKPQCTSAGMTIESCIQHCLEWSPQFIYAGVTYGQECWCDTSLSVGSTSNVCRSNVGAYCDKPCAGDKNQVRCCAAPALRSRSGWLAPRARGAGRCTAACVCVCENQLSRFVRELILYAAFVRLFVCSSVVVFCLPAAQNCGGFFEVNVYRIRADIAVEVDDTRCAKEE